MTISRACHSTLSLATLCWFKVDNKAMTNSYGVVGVVESSLSQYVKEKWKYGVHKERFKFLNTQMEVKLKKPSKKCISTQRGLKFIKPSQECITIQGGGFWKPSKIYISTQREVKFIKPLRKVHYSRGGWNSKNHQEKYKIWLFYEFHLVFFFLNVSIVAMLHIFSLLLLIELLWFLSNLVN